MIFLLRERVKKYLHNISFNFSLLFPTFPFILVIGYEILRDTVSVSNTGWEGKRDEDIGRIIGFWYYNQKICDQVTLSSSANI